MHRYAASRSASRVEASSAEMRPGSAPPPPAAAAAAAAVLDVTFAGASERFGVGADVDTGDVRGVRGGVEEVDGRVGGEDAAVGVVVGVGGSEHAQESVRWGSASEHGAPAQTPREDPSRGEGALVFVGVGEDDERAARREGGFGEVRAQTCARRAAAALARRPPTGNGRVVVGVRLARLARRLPERREIVVAVVVARHRRGIDDANGQRRAPRAVRGLRGSTGRWVSMCDVGSGVSLSTEVTVASLFSRES